MSAEARKVPSPSEEESSLETRQRVATLPPIATSFPNNGSGYPNSGRRPVSPPSSQANSRGAPRVSSRRLSSLMLERHRNYVVAPTETPVISSSSSSEDFHRYAPLYAPNEMTSPAAVATGDQPWSPVPRPGALVQHKAVEVLDAFGEPHNDTTAERQAVTNGATRSGVLQKVIGRTVSALNRWLLGSRAEVASDMRDAHAPMGANEAIHSGAAPFDNDATDDAMMLKWATNPAIMPTTQVRQLLLSSHSHRGAESTAGGITPFRVDWHGATGAPVGGSGQEERYGYFADGATLTRWGEPAGEPAGEGAGGMGDDITLADAIHMYQEDPTEYNGIMIAAQLSKKNPDGDPITAEDLLLTNGNPFIVTQLVQSGALPRVGSNALIERQLQSFVDNIFATKLSRGRIHPTSYEYLRCLTQVPCIRLSSTQVSILRRSGFEFLSLLYDFPHLEADNKDIKSTSARRLRHLLGHQLDLPLAVLGQFLVCLDFASAAIVAQYWYFQYSTYGYITLLCYLGGYVMDMVAMIFLVRNKANSAVYDGRITAFPSVNLKVFPVVPVYELVLFSSIARHAWDAARHKGNTSLSLVVGASSSSGLPMTTTSAGSVGGKKHLAMIHDLYAMMTLVRATHSVFFSMPHAIVQSYLFDWGTLDEGTGSAYYGYKMVLASSISCVILAMVVVTRQLTVFDSISGLGFARFATDKREVMQRRTVLPRILTLALVYLFEINVFFLIIGALNYHLCSTNTTVWIALSAGVVLACMAIFVASGRDVVNTVHHAAKWFIVPVLIQTTFTIFMTVRKAQSIAEECRLFVRAGSTTVIVGYVTWAVFGALGLIWFIVSCCVRLEPEVMTTSSVASPTTVASPTAAVVEGQ